MKKIFHLAVFLLLPGLYTASMAQKPEAALIALALQNPVEKVYIHYDKEYYVAGETIWFKAYLYNENKPSGLSSNFYVQFLDSKGKLVYEKKYPVMGAVVKGDIELADSLTQGNYYIRALTPGMLSSDEGFIYKKSIFVFNPSKGPVAAAKEQQTLSLQFFPESGRLVDGILSVVAFKATDQWGMPVDLEGILKTEDGTTIASFKTFHDGIGKVQFKPQAGKKYVGEVETAAGKRSYPLPEVVDEGINLKVQDEKGGKKFQLSRNAKEKTHFETVKIVAQINNHVVYENDISFEDYPSVVGHLITDSLPSGILHFTIFNSDGMPLAERLTFIDNGEYRGEGNINTIKTATTKRAENTLEISFAGAIQRSCSVAVVDQQGPGLNDNDNIWSRFLLTSDLKGHIYNPAWYFVNKNDSVKQAIDNLMLTHGWSRFNWTKILAGEYPPERVPDISLITITGKAIEEKTKTAVDGGKLNIFLEADDSTSQNYETGIDAQGQFRLDSVAFYGKAKLYYAYSDKRGNKKPALVILDENPIDKMTGQIPAGSANGVVSLNPFQLANSMEIATRYKDAKSKIEDVKDLENVNIRSKSSKKPLDIVNEKYTKGVFRTPGKVNIDNINDPVTDKSMNAVDFVKNRIQQLEVQGGNFVNRKNMSLMSGQKWLVGIFIDEAPADINQLRTLRADQLALIKFYEAGFVGVGSGSPGGALAVYTKEANTEVKPDKLESVSYNGYSVTKEFYQPDYSVADKHSLQDNRSTLYWNPAVYTDAETSSVKLSFYNNDLSKRFKVIVEGFDAAGKLIHIEKIIE
jgi:hypothetical protein